MILDFVLHQKEPLERLHFQCLTPTNKTWLYFAFASKILCVYMQVLLRNKPVTLSLQLCRTFPASFRSRVLISTWKCEPARLMALWVNKTEEDKAAFMAYACSRLHTYSLKGSFHLLISHQGISARLIPLGIYFSRQEASGKPACVDGQSTFDQTQSSGFLSADLTR